MTVEFDQYRLDLESMENDITEMGDSLEIPKVKLKIEELEAVSAKDGFWEDLENSQKVLQEIKQLKDKVAGFEGLKSEWEDMSTLVELAIDEDDESLLSEIEAGYKKLETDLENMRLETLLSGKYDANNAIISIHPGAGGTEAQDWASMLLRMYQRWGERRGFSVETLDFLAGDEAGVKSVTIQLSGPNAYGYAKCEKGVHRLVRISPFDASGRRHTSFASVDVMPEINDDIEVNINPEDIRVDTFRASGAGGQHINKTDSAIRMTHIPTGVVVSCQNERSQHQNRETAMKMLKAKLVEMAEREQMEKIEDLKGDMKDIAWGSQIRSYVFHPYNMVKDHRTNFEVGNIGAVMDGDLDGFINAYLKAANTGNLNLK
ncbi:peptide chain release factor 2 [Congzhengia minquanensis]|uniref:Peptide chain release factor 2 n=1 Tax=Congzhengia minquanensis TaxID=2763657 RepID=A0A926DLR3_9FIRM|nr:peptide chain release factor 2 [Congzhengia minquanensis]MBC8540328.1 peptide chain release factor 2 [Congzhengia minquanensis]